MARTILLAVATAAVLPVFAKGPEVELDLASSEELRESLATIDKTIVAKPPPPPKTVAFWDFDKEKPDLKGLPRGWCAGNWGKRRVDYGTEEGYGGKGRSMKIGVRYIVGGELQIYQDAWWAMQKGDYYRVSFKARGFDHPSGFSIQIREIAGAWRTVLGHLNVKLTNEWKEYSFGGFIWGDMKPGVAGIMIGVNEAGYFALDDIKVETFGPHPPPASTVAEKPPAPVPVTYGNLIPRGSCESPEDAFWSLSHLSPDPDEALLEPGFSRAEGGMDGGHCLRVAGKLMPNGKLSGGASIKSIEIPVATGQVYTLSVWAKTTAKSASIRIGGAGRNNENPFGRQATLIGGNNWVNILCRTKPIPQGLRSVNLSLDFPSGAEVLLDRMYFGCDNVHAQKLPASAPCELALGFNRKDPDDPRIVWWGEKLPLTVGAWKSFDEDQVAPELIPATIRVTAWPNRVSHEEKVVLKVGEERQIEVDPEANGVLRVEIFADDPKVAKRNELVMGRLPKPRATGAKGRFGIHARISPQVLALARAMGLTWQRIHDCSPITSMSWGNPKPGEYRWADLEVDALRKYGFSILGKPDYPPKWLIEEKMIVDKKWEAQQKKKDDELSFDIPKETFEDVDDGIAEEIEKKNEESDRMAHSRKVIVYNKEAFHTWCREAAKHYRGKIDHWEMWNEPYMEYFFKGDIMEFGRVFNAGAQGIREGNPDAKVLGWCNEFTSPGFSNPFRKQYPVSEKPDYNSFHLYFGGLQGTGECGIEEVLKEYPKTFGEYMGSELWNSEGGWPTGGSLYTWNSRWNTPESLEMSAASAVRAWGETFFAGVDRIFFYMMFNVSGAMDYDRSLCVWGAATAVTAYFIDAMKPVRAIKSPKGMRLRVFTGCGRSSAYIFDDCLERGKPKFNPAKLPAGWLVTDAMGNDIRSGGTVELGFAPYFVLAEGVEPEKVGEAVCRAVMENESIKPDVVK